VTSSKPITVIVADDHAVIRQCVCALLNADGRFLVVGEAENGHEAVKMERNLLPDVILMDISMPGLNGLEATRQIVAANPSAKVIILSAYNDKEYVDRAYAVGAAGMLAKQAFSETLTKTVREVVKGRGFFGPFPGKRPSHDRSKPRVRNDGIRSRAAQLTSRESEVLQLLAGGAAHNQVAAKLRISIKSVQKHFQRLVDKLKITETADLTRFAIVPTLLKSSVQLTIT
jgi:DNA-binding NarL/FixJ family response regulator